MRKAAIFIVVALLVTLFGTPVYAADTPPLPHAFYGTVEINGSSAPTGTTTVEARGEGVELGTYNPITVTETGRYGGPGGLDPKLVVQGDIADKATITFYVNGVSTDQTYPFDSGETTELPLSVTITEPEPEPSPPPVVGAPTYYIETNLFGVEAKYRITIPGEILETIEAASEDGMLTITIPKGTIALGEDGKRLKILQVAVNESPPEPPEGTYLIAAYDFGPDGATFDPAITLTWSYDPETLPEDVDLAIAYYDEVNEEWVWVLCVVDTVNNIITASIAHFTTFAIIAVPVELPPVVVPPVGEEEEEEEEEEEVITVTPAAFSVSNLSIQPAEVSTGEEVRIEVAVTNTGGTQGSYTLVLKINGVKEAERKVTIDAGDTLNLIFPVTREEAGIYTITVDGLSGSFTVVLPIKPPGVNWPMIVGITCGVILVGLCVFFFIRRRRAAY